jgi:SAM-dependent methyltransferase
MLQTTGAPVSPERIMQLSWGFAPPLMIEAAVRQGVFDTLDAEPKTVEQTADATGASPRGLRAVMNGLVAFGLLTKDGQGRYAPSAEASAFLVSGKPSSLAGFFRHISSQLIPGWLDLAEIVRSGRPTIAVNQHSAGAPFFVDLVEDLFPLNYPAASALGKALGVPALQASFPVLDLAAGSGVWGIALAQQSPHVTITAVDWPEVLPITRRFAARFGLESRLTCIAGDLLEAEFGQGHALATLGHILHSEGADRSRTLLKKTFRALAPGGTIAISEWIPNEERTGPPSALIFAVNMLVNTEQGDTYTFSEISGWLREAGFENERLLEAPGPGPLVLATKPAA